MSDLVRAVHDALNATALPRHPDHALPPTALPAISCPLPVDAPPVADLAEVLERRRSTYSFGRSVSLGDVGSLLRHGFGAAPRAGGLPSLVPYLVTRGVDGLAPGVHLADLRLPTPGLAAIRIGDPTAYLEGALDQPLFAPRVPLWLALVADLEVARDHYPSRHYRTLHVDAGAALQNVLLVATARDLTVCPVMGYDDGAWARLLDLNEDRFVTVLVAIGGVT